MEVPLSPLEARVIGSLIEKAITTPDQYPLSLKALSAACNQKSNREPVLSVCEGEVQETLDGLIKRHLVVEKSGFGSRVPKYQHRFCNTEFSPLRLTEQELGLICVLLLRGPQTPGELRTRTARLCSFEDVREVEGVLEGLRERPEGPLVARLPREPGRRESRYLHLFGDAQPVVDQAEPEDLPGAASGSARERIERLERALDELGGEVTRLKERLERLDPAGPGEETPER